MTVGKVLLSLAETACNSFAQKRMLTVSTAVFDNRLWLSMVCEKSDFRNPYLLSCQAELSHIYLSKANLV